MSRWPQGLWVVTPEGQPLAFHYHKNTPGLSFAQNQQKWVDDTAEMLRTAVKAAGPLPPRSARAGNPFPDRGLGLTRDGGVRLAVSVIGTRNGRQEGPPAIDSVLLGKDEWAAFAPPEGKGDWQPPEAIAKTFAPALSPMTDSILVPRPADLTKAAVSARVVRDAGGVWVVRYSASWESLHHRDGDRRYPIRAEATGEGVGVYDPAARAMRSLVWVLRGTYRNGTAAVPTASVVEWQAGE